MSTKTGKVTKVTASSSGSSATLHFESPPPPHDEAWNDPNDKVWAVLVAAYTKGSDVDVTYDDTTSPPTKTAVTAK